MVLEKVSVTVAACIKLEDPMFVKPEPSPENEPEIISNEPVITAEPLKGNPDPAPAFKAKEAVIACEAEVAVVAVEAEANKLCDTICPPFATTTLPEVDSAKFIVT